MTGDVTFTLNADDKATPKIKAVKSEMDRIGQMGVKKLAGELGGAVALSLGLAKGFGLVAVGITGAIAVSRILNQSISIETENLKEQQGLIAKKRDMMRQAANQQKQLEAGGIGRAPALRTLFALGGNEGDVKRAVEGGIALEDAIAGEIEVRKLRERDQETIRQGALRMASAGVATYEQSAKQLAKSRGNVTAASIAAMGLRPSSEIKKRVAGMVSDEGLAREPVRTMSEAITESARVGVYQVEALTSGRAVEALRSINQTTLDPVGEAKRKYQREIMETYKNLRQLADVSESVSARFKNLLDVGISYLPGGEGSLAADRFARNVSLAGGQ